MIDYLALRDDDAAAAADDDDDDDDDDDVTGLINDVNASTLFFTLCYYAFHPRHVRLDFTILIHRSVLSCDYSASQGPVSDQAVSSKY
jgi:hypothetical protein